MSETKKEEEKKETPGSAKVPGTIPAGYTVTQCKAVIKKVGLKTWKMFGYHKRLAALKELK